MKLKDAREYAKQNEQWRDEYAEGSAEWRRAEQLVTYAYRSLVDALAEAVLEGQKEKA